MAYAITDQWIIKGSKTKHLQIRQGAITKIKSTTNKAKTVNPKSYEKEIEEIERMIAELEELQVLRRLPHEEQFNRLEEAEQDEDDLDSDELLRKRRLENDEPDKKEQGSKYSVLSYHVGSVESGDKFMQKLKGNYKIFEQGDKLMQSIGVNN